MQRELYEVVAHLASVLQAMLHPGECTSLSATIDKCAACHVFDATINKAHFRFFIEIDGQAEETLEELKSRFASDLQDFIAESGATWGQLRPTPEQSD